MDTGSRQIGYLSDLFCLNLNVASTAHPSAALSADSAVSDESLRDPLGSVGAPLLSSSEEGAASADADEPAVSATSENQAPEKASSESEDQMKPGLWKCLVPSGTQTHPPSSLTSFCAIDACLLIFGGARCMPRDCVILSQLCSHSTDKICTTFPHLLCWLIPAGFNDNPDANLSEMQLVSLCPSFTPLQALHRA